ncbi:MAG: peptidase M20 [Lysobacteraceae bacterium]|nr:MAG: peptidase M20 [Xanthomonadaceae bacterium]
MNKPVSIALPFLIHCVIANAEPTHQEHVADAAVAKTILIDSVAFQTVQGHGAVPDLARYYADVLRNAGFSDDDIVITRHQDTATLEAVLHGRVRGKPSLLIGHMDVVAADPADWQRDPFTAVEEGGYIFGRGVSDNKFDVAMMVTVMASLKRENYIPRHDVVLVLSGDEETTQETTQLLAKQYADAELVLNSDAGLGVLSTDRRPLYYLLQAGEKSYADFEIEFTNPGGHSSRPSKPNAISQLAYALTRLDNYDFAPQFNELTTASLRGMALQVAPELSSAMLALLDDPTNADALATLRSDPEYVGYIGTTCVATMVKAGHAENALPQRATANVNCRIFPGVSAQEVKAELERVIDDPEATVKIIWDPLIAPASPLRQGVTDAVRKAVHANYPGIPVIPFMAAYSTDGVHFRARGIPTYGVSGLFQRPDDDFTHGLNERIPVAAIPVALAHWDRVIRELTR